MKMKVAQCWDDGVATDMRLIEILRKHNAKATFNLCPGNMDEETQMPYWVSPTDFCDWNFHGFRGGKVGRKDLLRVYGDFKVASHCWQHETVGRVSDEVFLKAAADAKKFLEDTFQRECPGFAYPCGVHTPKTEQMLKDAGFRYGRTTENTENVTACADPIALNSSCHFMAWDFWQRYDNAKKNGGAFYFWGHSYEMMEYDTLWDRFDAMIRKISSDPDVEWVDVIDLVPLCK